MATVLDCNHTASNTSSKLDCSLADTPRLIAGTVVFVVTLPFVLFQFRIFPIGTTCAVLTGATLMVVTGAVTQGEAYEVIGHKHNMTTVCLLMGIMLISQYFEREQLLHKLLRRILKPHHKFESYIWRICLLTFVLSAIFTNDTCCAILSPLLLKFWEAQERPQVELQTILLAIATSANIGSVTTVFGNPQMILIATRTELPPYTESRLDQRRCFMFLGLPAFVACAANIGFLILHHRIKTKGNHPGRLVSEASVSQDRELSNVGSENDILESQEDSNVNHMRQLCVIQEIWDNTYDQSQTTRVSGPVCQLETIIEDEELDIQHRHDTPVSYKTETQVSLDDTNEEKFCRELGGCSQLESMEARFRFQQLTPLTGNSSLPTNTMDQHGLLLSSKAGIYRSLSAVSVADYMSQNEIDDHGMSRTDGHESSRYFTPTDSILFQGTLIVVILTIVALYFASSQQTNFDLGLVPIAGAVILIVIDALLNRRNAFVIIQRVDWSILLMFFGLFVWLNGFNRTKIPRWIWCHLGLANNRIDTGASIVVFCLIVMIGSNVFSNVPFTLILLEQLEPCHKQLAFVLYLAWCSTIAGNLTLFGSVANLIVVQKGHQTLGYRLSFFSYLKYGVLTTLFIMIFGIILIFGLLSTGMR